MIIRVDHNAGHKGCADRAFRGDGYGQFLPLRTAVSGAVNRSGSRTGKEYLGVNRIDGQRPDRWHRPAGADALPACPAILAREQARITTRENGLRLSWVGDQRLYAAVERKRRAMARPGVSSIRAVPHAPTGRAKRLMLAIVEFELAWAPHLLSTMDYTYRERHGEAIYRFKDGMLPSDFFHRNVMLSFQEDAIGIRLRDVIGVDNMMWGSDYPHSESTFPQSRKILSEILAGVPDQETRTLAEVAATNEAFRANVVAAVTGAGRAGSGIRQDASPASGERKTVSRRAFPFDPALMDVFYSKWTSGLPLFQRTRGVLRTFAVGGRGLKLQDDARESTYSIPPKLESGGGGLVSTAQDYLRFCRMMLNGGTLDGVQILSPKTVALFSLNYLPDGREVADMGFPGMFSESSYAGVGFSLGCGINIDVAKTRLPGSLGEYFWGGAAATAFWIDPKEELTVVS
jgi:beta-lactamase family protein